MAEGQITSGKIQWLPEARLFALTWEDVQPPGEGDVERADHEEDVGMWSHEEEPEDFFDQCVDALDRGEVNFPRIFNA